MAESQRRPILIAGAGLASLLLARSLKNASIPFIVFEQDKSIAFRAQGYRLRLSGEGLDAVESILGPEGFAKFWAKCGQSKGGPNPFKVDAGTGEMIEADEAGAGGGKEKEGGATRGTLASRGGKTIGISRGDMRALFLEGCEEHVQWGQRVFGYELTSDGVKAIFEDGSRSVEGDLLVGGDGIRSKIAKQVSHGKLKVFDTGARSIHGQTATTAFKGLGEGVWTIIDRSRTEGRVFTITNVRSGDMDDPNIEFGWNLALGPGVIKNMGEADALYGQPAAQIARSLTSKWHSRVQPIFSEMNEGEAAFWRITCSTPSGVPEWTNEPRITVIGDAVHSMTPAGGLGANTAMRDSELLGRLLAESGGWKEGITAQYEKEMRVYGSQAVKTSYGIATEQFGILIDEETTPTVG